MFILVLSKRLPMMEEIVRTGRWDLRGDVKGIEPKGRTLGIVGFGSIGQEVARLVAPFKMELLVYDPYLEPSVAQKWNATLVSLDEMLKESDFVSLHCLLTDETRGLIGVDELARMKPTAYLINMARGPVVDHEALVNALQSRQIAGAGLDVFYHEPLPADDPLVKLDNVVLTPHWAAGTLDVFRDAGISNITDMVAIARGQLPQHIVNPDVIDRPGFQQKLNRFQR
jgi:phosphoglycerate dehydrogenase-like enzyme